jgi:hypothetical protein
VRLAFWADPLERDGSGGPEHGHYPVWERQVRRRVPQLLYSRREKPQVQGETVRDGRGGTTAQKIESARSMDDGLRVHPKDLNLRPAASNRIHQRPTALLVREDLQERVGDLHDQLFHVLWLERSLEFFDRNDMNPRDSIRRGRRAGSRNKRVVKLVVRLDRSTEDMRVSQLQIILQAKKGDRSQHSYIQYAAKKQKKLLRT